MLGSVRKSLMKRAWRRSIPAVLVLLTVAAGVVAVTRAPTADASIVGGVISRTEILARAQWWIDTYGAIYSQSQADAKPSVTGERYRPDCSGFVSMAWRLPKVNGVDRDTRNLTDFGDTTRLASFNDLRPGDAILREGNPGHVVLFDRWTDSTRTAMWIYEEYSFGQEGHHVIRSRQTYDGFIPIGYDKVVGSLRAAPAMGYDDGDGTMTIHRWSSTGTGFGHSSDYTSGSFSLSRVGDRVAAGDVDGDGDDDIVMAYQNGDGSSSLHVFRNGLTWSGVWYAGGRYDLGRVAGRLVVGDFSGDGRAEPAMVYDDGDGTMTIHRWVSTGTGFSHTSDYTSGSFSLSRVGDRVAAADVDGDGDDDIAMAYQNSDGTASQHVFRHGLTWSGIWYTGGQYNLDRVAGRLILGAW